MLNIVKTSLDRQTERSFEWIIPTPKKYANDVRNIVGSSGAIIETPKKKDYMVWDLNSSYNLALKQARGKLIVSYQDGIWTKPDLLDAFWFHYKSGSRVVVGAIGDQYSSVDEYGMPTNRVWEDPRKRNDFGSFYECYPEDVEFSLAAIPYSGLVDIGGFDEELDRYYSGDNVSVMHRLYDCGYIPMLDQGIVYRAIKHGRASPEWDAKHAILTGAYDKRKEDLIKSGQWPRLPYLD
jgi:hypothetical protein